jgi:hypothetical protein
MGGLCLLSDSTEEFPEDLGDCYRMNVYHKLKKEKSKNIFKNVVYCQEKVKKLLHSWGGRAPPPPPPPGGRGRCEAGDTRRRER